MTTQPRLFARTREQHKDFKPLSPNNFIIALLDIYTDDADLRQELCRLPNCHYFRASTIEDCLNLITHDEAKNALIIFILRNQFLDSIRQNLLEVVPQRSYVYLFDSVLYGQQFLNDQRYRGTFDNVYWLFTKIEHDIKEVRRLRRVENGMQFISEENAKFFWYRFFFNILHYLQHTDITKYEILPRLLDDYHDNVVQLNRIDEFDREYRSDNVISCYTEDSFFYRSINKALRESDINEIFIWRTYIQDIDRALRQLRLEQETWPCTQLYRGQLLFTDDLNKLKENVGKLITVTSFLSTSVYAHTAAMFAGTSDSDSTLSSVLFIINIKLNDTKAIFADIQSLSYFRDEREYLFSLRSMFRINAIDVWGTTWVIELTAADEDDQEFCQAINPWKAKISEQSFFSGRHRPLFIRHLNLENSSFLAFQLLIDLMLRLNQTSFARREMIEMCRLKYSDSLPDLNKIDGFERTYNHQDAAEWYTTDSFLYRLLNNSLRLEDIDTIFKLRYYIYDLHNQLAQHKHPMSNLYPRKNQS